MIVEDEALIAFGLQDLLQDDGFEVMGPFSACADALAGLQGARPDFAILDAILRDGPCLELARDLRRRAIPFMIYSGRDAFEERPPELAGVEWVEKPSSMDAVLAAASRLMKPQGRDQSGASCLVGEAGTR